LGMTQKVESFEFQDNQQASNKKSSQRTTQNSLQERSDLRCMSKRKANQIVIQVKDTGIIIKTP
ncbi:hypothetical protein, partial [Escherichia coli]|uniref:hypothetical protein n=1 Tax=Escherichia coli TaxID=562 RepID=UPI0032D9CDE8